MPFEERFAYAKKQLSVIVKMLKVDIEVVGKNNIPLENGFLFVGNHQGSADAFVFLNSSPVSTTAVSKVEGKKIPFLSDWYDALEVIYFDRENMRDAVRMANDVAENLKNGRNVTIFPEGTRAKSNIMNPFKPGAFKGATKCKAPIVPFALVNAYIPLDSSEPVKPIKVVFLQPLHYEEYKDYSSQELSAEIQSRIQSAIDAYL